MYTATALEVLVASPSDTADQREVIREAIFDWNRTNSRYLGVTTLPLMWETHTHPEFGGEIGPQAIVNKQIVDDADILVATFWTKLGSPTPEAASGTVEEIERFVKAGKPVLVYFCEMQPVLFRLDTAQLDAVRDYREKLESQALLGTYESLEELAQKVRDDLTKVIRRLIDDGTIAPAPENAPSTPAGNGEDKPGLSANQAMRDFLAGYAAKWRSEVSVMQDSELTPPDRWYALAGEMQRVVLETQRRVAEQDRDSLVLMKMVEIVGAAAGASMVRVYLDGGRSYKALVDAVRTVLESVEALVEDDAAWEAREA